MNKLICFSFGSMNLSSIMYYFENQVNSNLYVIIIRMMAHRELKRDLFFSKEKKPQKVYDYCHDFLEKNKIISEKDIVLNTKKNEC